MPCSDITEVIQVVIDDQDRLKDYFFAKRTCGKSIGAASLLLDELKSKPVDELLAYTAESFLDEFPVEDELEEFMRLKHFFAVQGALEVLTGVEPGGPKSLCAAAEIGYEDGDLLIDARISIELVTDKIKSCGNCKGCGTKKAAKVVFS